jgi:hypothetical protein
MKPTLTIRNAVIYQGNNLEVLPTLPDNSVDSIVCDPPYELGFMGKSWDSSGIAYSVELWKECLRVLKPGGHLLAFGGTRTWHRLAVAIEDAGFEIRDMIAWISNKTFPKSHNISKAISKADLDSAKYWEGWGTALKPTVEPIVLARKPVEGTIAQNVLQYGVGGLNIDKTRIPNVRGRWPANLVIDEATAEELDKQSGISKPKAGRTGKVGGQQGLYENGHKADYVSTWVEDFGGGASRFFYVARARNTDRNEGLGIINKHPTVKPTALMQYLIRLVTPANGVVLDPFAGSGSTGKAAILENKHFIGIELTAEYLPIIEGRLQHAYETLDSKQDE